MKKIVTLLLAAGLMLGGATASQAVDINVSGEMVFVGEWSRVSGNKRNVASYNGSSHNSFYQRFRAQVDITASEALNGVVMFEIGDTMWGKSRYTAGADNSGRSTGGAIGADGVTVEVKRAYLDWIPPNTDLKIRMGIQGFATPTFITGGAGSHNNVFDDDVAGITLNYQWNESVGTTVWWMRPYADNNDTSARNPGNRKFDEMDMFGLSIPLTFDGVKVTPWGQYAAIGRDFREGVSTPTAARHTYAMLPAWIGNTVPNSSDGQGSGWWAGLTGEVTAWNPFRLSWDFVYGSVDMGHIRGTNNDVERSGWIATIMAEYKLDFMTPGLAFWYGSGDDDKGSNGSEMLPTIKASSGLTSFGMDAAGFNMPGAVMATSTAGTWGIMAQLKDISFVEDLKHTLRVTYYRGTNDKDMARDGWVQAPWNTSGDANYMYLTDKDSAWEFNLDSSYQIYKNLSVGLELGYIRFDISDSAWSKRVENDSDDMYKIAVGLRYTF